MEETVEHPFSGDGTLYKKPPSSSKLLQHLSQAMPNAKSDMTQGMTSSQQQAVKETAVHEEVILRDIVEGCSDDREGNYFDKYVGGVSVKSSIDLSHAIISEPTSEEIISLAEFIGNNVDNTPFLPSQEPSDDEQLILNQTWVQYMMILKMKLLKYHWNFVYLPGRGKANTLRQCQTM